MIGVIPIQVLQLADKVDYTCGCQHQVRHHDALPWNHIPKQLLCYYVLHIINALHAVCSTIT